MGSVTDGTGKTGIDVEKVVVPTLIQPGQVVALGTEGVGAGRTQVWIGVKKLARDRLARSRSLRERILALENVAVL